MQSRNQDILLVLVYICPACFYLLPLIEAKLIPEIGDNIGVIYFIIFILVFILYVIVLKSYWRKSLKKRSKKWLVTFLSVFVLLVHYALFVFIEVETNLSFSTPKTVFTRKFHNNRIYIREWRGFFNVRLRTEIGYSKSLSPFYHVYFKTPKNVELIKADAVKLVFEEFEYVKDTILSESQGIRIVDRTIQIAQKDLE